MIIVTGEARFGDGEIERLKPRLRRRISRRRGPRPAARAMPMRSTSPIPNLLHIAEEWSDEEAIDAHMAAPHMAELMAALGGAKIEAISINAYEAHFLKTLLGGS